MRGLLAFVLTFGVASHTLLAYWANFDPERVLKLRSNHPGALLKAAQDRVNDSLTVDQATLAKRFEDLAKLPISRSAEAQASQSEEIDPQSLEGLARRILRSNPISAQPLAMLGSAVLQEGDAKAADTFMEAAALRSPRLRIASYWMMRKYYETADYQSAIYWANGLLRLSPSDIRFVAPILWRMAENKDAAPNLIAALQLAPPWRATLFQNAKGNISDARAPLQVYLQLKADGNAPPNTELTSYIALLLENKLYDVAYNTWLQTLSPDQLKVTGFLYDGGFDFNPGPSPFEWTYARSGVQIGRQLKEDQSGMAMRIDFSGGRTSSQLLTQTTMLMPGAYTLVGSYRGEVRARRGLIWTMSCVGSSEEIGRSEAIMPNKQDWMNFETRLTVPPQNCRAQTLSLRIMARSPSETMLTGRFMLDDLAIRRAEQLE